MNGLILSSRSRGGFSFVEVLISIGIISLLGSLLVPTMGKLLKRAEATACVANLRQVGICALLYSADNDRKFPMIEPWPSDPVYAPEENAKTILEVLGPYGLTEKTVACRADLAGPNYFAKEGSSFQWCPMANGQNLSSVKLSWDNLGNDVPIDRLLLAFDYTNVHFGKSNVLFGDGHVAAAFGD